MILETQSTAGAVPIISQLTESTNFCSTDQANIPRKKIFTKISRNIYFFIGVSVNRKCFLNLDRRSRNKWFNHKWYVR